MAKNSQDEIARSYVRLSALRKNIEKIPSPNIEEIYVHEFHNILDRIKDVGIDISDFRVPDSVVRNRVRGSNMVTGEKWYSDEKYVDKPLFLTKLDAVLGYFEIITSPGPKKIGYRKPEG